MNWTLNAVCALASLALAASVAPALRQQAQSQEHFCRQFPQECRPLFSPPRGIIYNP